MTKEELQKKITRLDQANENYFNQDKNIRKEFARAFDWFEKPQQFIQMGGDVITPSWEQIFIEVGKLLESKHTDTYITSRLNEINQDICLIRADIQNDKLLEDN